MFINPREAIEQGWVTGLYDPDVQCQPNAIDFTADTIYTFTGGAFALTNDDKQHRKSEKLEPQLVLTEKLGEQLMWSLPEGCYDVSSSVHVKLPEGVAALTIIRSTLNRNGVFFTSGLYDSGYEGAVAGMLHVRCPVAYIAPGTRIGQIMFVKSDSAGVYAGGYNHEEGTHWSEK